MPTPETVPTPPPAEPLASPCTCFQVRRAARVITNRYDAALAGLGLRITQFSILAHLVLRPYPLSDLAETLLMDRTTLTRTLRPMQEAGWLSVMPDPDDRRVRQAMITASGQALYEQAVPAWKAIQRQVRDTLGREEVADLHTKLTRASRLLAPP